MRAGATHTLGRLLAAPVLIVLSACGSESPSAVDPAALLERAAARIEATTSYHYVLDFDGGAAPIALGLGMRHAEGMFAGAANFDAAVLASAGPIDVRVGIRAVNGETWITNPLTGLWQQQPLTVAQLFDISSGVTALMRGATDLQVGGTETIEGVTVRRIDGALASERFRLMPGVPPGQQLRASAWVGVEDDLVRRLEVRGRGAPFAATADAEGVVRVSLSRFDEPANLVPPTP